jgi:hypothetical protein
MSEQDILDVAVTHLANDDYNHIPEDVLRGYPADADGDALVGACRRVHPRGPRQPVRLGPDRP